MELAALIDHAALKPDLVASDVARLCDEVQRHGFATACVPPVWVRFAARRGVKVASTVGFPHGNARPDVKADEARRAVDDGAAELDMVMHIGALLSGDGAAVRDDVAGVVAAGVPVKVILETALLDDGQKRAACRLAETAGAAFVKTSTGFGPGGATTADVRLLAEAVGGRLGVKASGGIRDRATAEAMVAAGATRLGCSSSVAIVGGA